MAQNDTPESRTSSPSLSERVRSITTLRARFSSTSRTTLVDDHDTETVTADESDHASSTAERHKSTPVPYSSDYIFDQLQPSKPLRDRIYMIEQISPNAGSYPIPMLMSVWKPIQDMYCEGSLLDARRVCFGLATAIADLKDVPFEAQQQLYKIITEPAPSDLLDDQVRSLKILTKKGARTDPFSPDIGRFLTINLKCHFASIVEVRKRNRGLLPSRDPASPGRERGLSGLFGLIANIEKQNPQAIQTEERSMLLQELFAIAEKTSLKRDMKGVVTVLEPIIRASGIPLNLRRRCVELLCAICNAVERVREDTKASLFFLLRSDCKDDVVQILLETLSLALNDRHTSTVCGALSVLLDLIKNKGQDGLPMVTFGQFIEPFSHVHYGSRTTRCACLHTISDLLANKALREDILRSDWKYMIDTILTATGDEIYEPGQTQPLRIEHQNRTETHAPVTEPYTDQLKEQVKQKKLADAISDYLQQIASSLNSFWSFLNPKQRSLVARFYNELVDVLPEGHLLQLVEETLFPLTGEMSNLDARTSIRREEEVLPGTTDCNRMDALIDLFVLKHRIAPLPYGRVMKALRYDIQRSHERNDHERVSKLTNVVETLLSEFKTIQQGGWLKAAELAQVVAAAWKVRIPIDLDAALDQMIPLVYAAADHQDIQNLRDMDITSVRSAQHGMTKVTLALVEVFLEYLPHFTTPSTLLYERLLQIASDRSLSANIRLPALRLLARMRCDQGGSIFVIPNADCFNLAPYLGRTEDTKHQLAVFQQPSSQVSTPIRASRPEGIQELRRSRKSIELLPKPIQKSPLWMYPGGPGLPQEPPSIPSSKAFVYNSRKKDSQGTFNMHKWLSIARDILQYERDWEVYSYVAVHLPSQLANSSLFVASFPEIRRLRKILVGQLLNGKFLVPAVETQVKKGDVACCLLQTLTILLGYAEKEKEEGDGPAEYFQQSEEDELVKVFLYGIGTWDRAGQICVQALTVACHAIPVSITRTIGAILGKLERYITTTHLTVDILEFLANVACIQQIHTNIIGDDHRKAFAICIKYLEFARELRSRLQLKGDASHGNTTSAKSSVLATSMSEAAETKDQDDRHKDLPQYVFVLAYHVLTHWFLAVKLQDRSKHVEWISSKLAWKDAKGKKKMEEQSQVMLDMMLRSAYSDLGESQRARLFTQADGVIQKKTWLVGMSIITVETAPKTGFTHITKRQISGTTYATYMQNTVPLAQHHVAWGGGPNVKVFPQHIFLQLTASISPVPFLPLEPVPLPDNDAAVEKALSLFDHMDTVDGYCIGVVYVRDGKSKEREILSETTHSCHFRRFMEGMGTKVALRGATFNTHGLDKVSDQDGSHTYAWRDRLVEMVYAVPSMMPNYEHDLQCTNKKRHVGNSFVTIIWNESGLPYEFNTIASQFNSVIIVIVPENSVASSSGKLGYQVPQHEDGDAEEKDDPRYKIQTITHSSLPHLSPCASIKLLPLKSLAGFVRQVALNSAIFSNVWSNRATGEYSSSWRERLRAIGKLRKQYAPSDDDDDNDNDNAGKDG